MCGFIGLFQAIGQLDDSRHQQVSSSLDRITHRGPDDGHEMSGAQWHLGFRRLSIQDLSLAGRQPMVFEGGRKILVFNGEIYNYHHLREQQQQAGFNFKSKGDAEVLGALLSREPVEQVLPRLRGMFSFIWWTPETQELIAARDHFGIKPLYYSLLKDGTLILGSELKAIRPLLPGAATVSKAALAQYFRWGAVQAPGTIFEGVHCLPPGHLLRWKAGTLTIERYFKPSWRGSDAWLTGQDARQAARDVITQSVQAHLVSDVPVGVFLSAGLDSTLLAAVMREQGQGQQNIQAFSIGYQEGSGMPDESDAAERTARFLGCQFHRERLSSSGLFNKLDDYLGSLDQPTGDALNTWLVSQVAAQHVKVTLSGLGADEWFGGYNYHRILHLARRVAVSGTPLGRLAAPAVGSLNRQLPAGLRQHPLWKALIYASGAAGTDLPSMHRYARSIFHSNDVAELLSLPVAEAEAHTAQSAMDGQQLHELHERAPDSWLHQLLLLETETYLANTLLRDCDVTSMAHSLELRVPLVDREVFDLSARIAPEEKLNLSGGKQIIRAAFRDLLPEWIAQDKRKKTFTLPLMKWMREEPWKSRVTDVLGSQKCRERGWLNPEAVTRHLDSYYGSSREDQRAWQLSQPVWLMFVLESWACGLD